MDTQPQRGTCVVCGHHDLLPVLNKNNFTIARCSSCEMLQVSPVPSGEFLRAHYQDPAYFGGEEEQGYRSYADMKKALAPHFARRLRAITTYLPGRGRLLDFGCAAGYFLEMARADGWDIAGVELAQDMARQASDRLGIKVASSLEELPKRDFDTITLWEVIEHLPRPVEELRQLYERLRPGGPLMLSTPNNGHWQAVHEPEAWTSYRPPSHLLYFTAQTLENVLQRAGFERITIRSVSPLPPLPNWLRRASAPLQHALTTGKAKPWRLALLTWRAIRIVGWSWQRLVRPRDDIFTTLEAMARRPA